jgi:hypothetical protein
MLSKLLPSGGCSLKSEVTKFCAKLIWTRLLKFTKTVRIAKGKFTTFVFFVSKFSSVLAFDFVLWRCQALA